MCVCEVCPLLLELCLPRLVMLLFAGFFLQCAMLSPTFKVREFSISDIQPYAVQLNWKAALEGETG